MELFIPSLLVLLIAGLLAFLIIPRSTVPVVLGVSLLILLYVLNDHYGKFYNEYRYSTWQYTAQGYAPYVIVAILILFILTTSSFTLHSSGWQTQVQTPTLPTATSATNPVTSAINSGIRAVSSTAAAATTAVTNTVAAATSAVKNAGKNKNSGSAYNISALLGSTTKNS
jgi:hypothetical protein